jgi:hypothetical protein
MNEVAVLSRAEIAVRPVIPAMSPESVDMAREAEARVLAMPQVSIRGPS